MIDKWALIIWFLIFAACVIALAARKFFLGAALALAAVLWIAFDVFVVRVPR